MRELAGLAALNAVYLGVGTALLAALGRPVRIADGGLALASGWAVVGISASFALMLGASLASWQVVTLGGLLAAALAVAAMRRTAEPANILVAVGGRAGQIGGYLGAVILALVLAASLGRALTSGADTEWDVWAFWLAKAKAIYFFDGLDTGPGGFTSYDNPEYPPLAPALEAAAFHFIGGARPSVLLVQQWLLAAGFFGALWALLRPRVGPLFLWPPLAMLAAAPAFSRYVDSVLADAQVAYAIGIAGILGALWLTERRTAFAVLAAVFLAAASLLKTEGFVLAALLAVLVLGLALAGGARARPAIAALGAAPLVGLVPWKLWLAANDAPLSSSLYSLGDAFRPAYLAGRLDRLGYALEEMVRIVFAPDLWLLVVPLAVAGTALALRRAPALGFLVAGWTTLAFLGLAGVYWIGRPPVEWYVDTSAQRVLTSLVVFCGSLLPLLLAETARPRRGPR